MRSLEGEFDIGPHREKIMGEQKEIKLQKISMGETSRLDLRFYLSPVPESSQWEELFQVAGSTEWESPPSLVTPIQAGGTDEYIVSWNDGPQDVDIALQCIDRYIDEANEAYGASKSSGSDA